MADVPSGGPAGDPRPNPSIESTRRDDEMDKRLHEEEVGAGAALGAGLGCMGVALAPWIAIAGGIVAALVIIVVVKGCGS